VTPYRNRAEAGHLLGLHLKRRLGTDAADAVVLAIPRGGVVVAGPVARSLGAPLDVIVPRKIGAPAEPELAIGAVAMADTEEILILDEATIAELEVPRDFVEVEARRQRREVERRLAAYREGRPAVPVAGRTAVIVDDGVATGLTARAAFEAVSRLSPRLVLVAAPVAPPETVEEFEALGIRLEVLETPSPFLAVGRFYSDFRPVEDDEVRAVLRGGAPS
jgi:predicted phosphoribosyltransferase